MRLATVAALSAVAMMTPGMPAEAGVTRVLSLDQCSDQYVLALAPDADLYLSPRADDPDAWMRWEARGRPLVRPTLEAALVVRPDIVVRSWGGDTKLLHALERRGIRVVQIADANSLAEVRQSTLDVAAALDRRHVGARVVRRMDETLEAASTAVAMSPQNGRSALYLTAAGFTAGRDTLVDSILSAAGYANAAGFSGFGPMSVERLVLEPPSRFVLGFFDQLRADWRGAGRHPVVRRAVDGRVVADLPAAALTCPAWFAADAARRVAEGSAR